MSSRLTLALACAGLLSASCAPSAENADGTPVASARPERQCFDVSQVRNFRQGRTATVYIRATGNDVYQVDSAGGCMDLDFANRLAIIPDFAGSVGGRVCTGDSAQIVVPGLSSSNSVCRVRITKRLSDEEVPPCRPPSVPDGA